MSEWIDRWINPPDIKDRILVISYQTGKIHLLHYDYDEWCLDETDEGSPGMTIGFERWMPLPEKR